MSDMFLKPDEIAVLTGRKIKSLQIEQRREMLLPFWVNAKEAPVVARVAVEGHTDARKPAVPQWEPPA